MWYNSTPKVPKDNTYLSLNNDMFIGGDDNDEDRRCNIKINRL